jgi:hypothetical protein
VHQKQEISISNKTTLIAFSMAVALGALAGSAAQAASDNTGGDTGGYVLPGSLDGVNPVYHPGIFRNDSAAAAYGFAPSSVHKHAWSPAKSAHRG